MNSAFEEGRYHKHVPAHEYTLACSHGHAWIETETHPCWCGWPGEGGDRGGISWPTHK